MTSVEVTPEVTPSVTESVASSVASTTESQPSSAASVAESVQSATPSVTQSTASSELSTASATESVASSVASVAAGPPETYKWVVKPGVEAPPALIERTAAIARSLGLSNEAGQALFDAEVSRVAGEKTANEKGGEVWQARVDGWTSEAVKDPVIGGSPEKFAQSINLGKRGLDQTASPKLVALLQETGLYAHPEVIRHFRSIGERLAEPALVTGSAQPSAPAKTLAERLYENDGMGPKST